VGLAGHFLRVVRAAALIALGLVALEVLARVRHFSGMPLLPYFFASNAALLEPSSDLTASFNGLAPVRYVTDARSARVGDPAIAAHPLLDDVLVVGDSQMLGYMVPFDAAFPSLVAQALTGNPHAVRVLAAPANHPGSYAAMLDQYVSGRDELEPRLEIVGINLGNDLDELYADGLAWTRPDTARTSRWLLRSSYAYMDLVLLENHWWHAVNEPPGINPIVYMLAADERLELAREAIADIDALLRDGRVSAARQVIVITPADYQVSPAQFVKYRPYYSSPADFERWADNISAFAQMMDAVEQFMAVELAAQGFTVIRFSQTARTAAGQPNVFDKWSHHLNATGHRLLARAIVDRLAP
jgi:lysophospholipase L1-like esterase